MARLRIINIMPNLVRIQKNDFCDRFRLRPHSTQKPYRASSLPAPPIRSAYDTAEYRFVRLREYQYIVTLLEDITTSHFIPYYIHMLVLY